MTASHFGHIYFDGAEYVSQFELIEIVRRAQLAAESAQLARDAEAICFWCTDARYEPATLDPNAPADEPSYIHVKKGGTGGWENCDATLLWVAYSEQDSAASVPNPSAPRGGSGNE